MPKVTKVGELPKTGGDRTLELDCGHTIISVLPSHVGDEEDCYRCERGPFNKQLLTYDKVEVVRHIRFCHLDKEYDASLVPGRPLMGLAVTERGTEFGTRVEGQNYFEIGDRGDFLWSFMEDYYQVRKAVTDVGLPSEITEAVQSAFHYLEPEQ